MSTRFDFDTIEDYSSQQLEEIFTKKTIKTTQPKFWAKYFLITNNLVFAHSPHEFYGRISYLATKNESPNNIEPKIKEVRNYEQKIDIFCEKFPMSKNEILLGISWPNLIITNFRIAAIDDGAFQVRDPIEARSGIEFENVKRNKHNALDEPRGKQGIKVVPLWSLHGRDINLTEGYGRRSLEDGDYPFRPIVDFQHPEHKERRGLAMDLNLKSGRTNLDPRQPLPNRPVEYLFHIKYWMQYSNTEVGEPPEYLSRKEIDNLLRNVDSKKSITRTNWHQRARHYTAADISGLMKEAAEEILETFPVPEDPPEEPTYCEGMACYATYCGPERHKPVDGDGFEEPTRDRWVGEWRETQEPNSAASQGALVARLREIEPRELEKLVHELLVKMGYEEVRLTPATNDKGVDVVARSSQRLSRDLVVVQVKRYASENSVGRPTLDALRGSMHRFDAHRGTIVTTSNFTQDARRAAKEKGASPITLINGRELAGYIKKYGLI